MPITDLLPLLQHKDGALELFNLDRHPSVTLFLRGGTLVCLQVNGREVPPIQARAKIALIASLRRGAFEFIPGSAPRHCTNPLGWPLEGLLLATVTMQDEIQEMRDRLPHPDTIFRAHGDVATNDPRLAEFLDRARHALLQGASARQLAEAIGTPLDQTRYYLAALRQDGFVEVVRLRVKANARASKLASRLLAALRQRFGGGGKS